MRPEAATEEYSQYCEGAAEDVARAALESRDCSRLQTDRRSSGPIAARVLELDGLPLDATTTPLLANGSRVIGMGATSASDPHQIYSVVVDTCRASD